MDGEVPWETDQKQALHRSTGFDMKAGSVKAWHKADVVACSWRQPVGDKIRAYKKLSFKRSLTLDDDRKMKYHCTKFKTWRFFSLSFYT